MLVFPSNWEKNNLSNAHTSLGQVIESKFIQNIYWLQLLLNSYNTIIITTFDLTSTIKQVTIKYWLVLRMIKLCTNPLEIHVYAT